MVNVTTIAVFFLPLFALESVFRAVLHGFFEVLEHGLFELFVADFRESVVEKHSGGLAGRFVAHAGNVFV